MTKRARSILFLGLAVVAVAVLALPVANLIVGLPPNPLTEARTSDPADLEVAHTLGAKCGACHTSEPSLPFYASWPVAAPMIRRDVAVGSSRVDYGAELTRPTGPVSEIVLAKTEYVLRTGSMPPLSFRVMHWDHTLSPDERSVMVAWIGDQLADHYADPMLPEDLARQVVRPIVASAHTDPRKVELGRLLFHDVRLSADDTLSCASCHGLDTGGTDRRRTSIGIGGAEGPINSPTVFNAVYGLAQFWDGRAGDLVEQADGPVNNPGEMGSNWPEAIAKLERDRPFTAAFVAAYPEGYSKETITDAIAAFEATLVTPDSPFDRWLEGETDAMSASQVEGWNRFRSYGCTTCHAGPALGGRSYETMGLHGNYFGERQTTAADDGRYNVTGDPADRHKFKVPTLRNVALTWPYLHDGSTDDLHHVVGVMAEMQCGRPMPAEDVDLVVEFLKALTGTWEGRPLG